MSFTPKDKHERQIQFALERGIPATLFVIGTKRLPFPDNMYDLIHCARCRVHWDADGGKPLIELNRVLRPEGFFVCNSLILDFEGCVHDFEGFALEDAIGLSLNGDVDVHSIFVVSLPTSHPSFAPQKPLEKSSRLKAPPLPDGPVELFIGILSAGNHFVERMAVWKSWMQHRLIKSSNVVARFFVALLKMIFVQHPRREVNVEVMKEAEFFGDIVLVPYMNIYDLVVLKTVAISEYGVRK